MQKRVIVGLSAWAILTLSLGLSASFAEKEEFEARLLQGGQQTMESIRKIKLTVDSYTTDEEILSLIKVFNEQGYEAFLNAFRALNKGTFLPIGGRGIKITIHAAHSIPTENGRQILIFTMREAWNLEVRQIADPRFSFMVVELNLDSKGKGTGKIYEQASIQMTPQKTFVMDGYNAPPKQFWDVRQSK